MNEKGKRYIGLDVHKHYLIALGVDDVEKAWKETTARGGKSAWSPREEKDDFGIYRTSAIYTYGETIHMFVDRDDYKGAFAPTYKPIKYEAESTGLAAIDHMVGNVQLGKMNHWVNFYHQVMGFRQLLHFDDKDISTEYSALMSKVMQNGNGRIKLPINATIATAPSSAGWCWHASASPRSASTPARTISRPTCPAGARSSSRSRCRRSCRRSPRRRTSSPRHLPRIHAIRCR